MKIGIIDKVTLLSATGILLLGVLLGVYFIRHETRALNAALDERAMVLVNSLSANSEYPLRLRDRAALDRLVNGIFQQRDVVLCEIEDGGGTIISSAGTTSGAQVRVFTAPIVAREVSDKTAAAKNGLQTQKMHSIGTARLVVSLTGLNKKIRGATLTMANFGLIGIALVSLATVYLLKRLFSRPIAMLVSGTQRIGHGDLDYKAPEQRDDEIGRLATALNKMTEDLKRVTVSKDYVDNILKSMNDALVVVSPQGRIEAVNGALCTMLGYQSIELIDQPVMKLFTESSTYQTLLQRENITNVERAFRTKSGTEIPVLISASVMRQGDGGVQGIVCSAKDISERKRAEEQINNSLEEKEVLLKEIHHRVKNNLQVISSLLYLQSENVQDQGTLEALKDSRNRVKSMALIHEKLYRSKDLAHIDFADYIRNLTGFLSTSYSDKTKTVTIQASIKDISLDINTAIPCGLIINELVSNSLKYAFPGGRRGRITIDMHSDNGHLGSKLNLVVDDDGVGLPQNIDVRNTESLGLQLVNTLVQQLNGTVQLFRREGTRFVIRFQPSR
jgi:PAS domain S-box-containing protein